jgi:translation initiation factor IF-3
MGIMFTRDALSLARSRDLDLVEVAPNAVPPVCRVMDYGKYRYEQGKRERESRKSQHQVVLKSLRLGPNTDEGDLKTRVNAARRFLDEGHKVKFEVQFHGRELAHVDIGRDLLNRILEELGADIVVESPPKMEGRKMSMVIARKAVQPKSQPRPPRPVQEQRMDAEGVPPANRAPEGSATPPAPRPAAEGSAAPAPAPADNAPPPPAAPRATDNGTPATPAGALAGTES